MRVPPPVYAVLTACLMWRVDRSLPIMRLVAAPYDELGWGLMVVGALFDAASFVLFLRAKTTINPLRPQRAQQLVTAGPYRISRNPMYLGLALVLSGWGLRLGSLGPLVLVAGFVQLLSIVQIRPEEAALTARFGARYVDYCRHVNRWIGWRHPD
jgi:protein-S-isoprenylcysteine O-methyltransferase Ste14